MNAGQHYGVGHKQPIGKEKASGLQSGAIPFGRKPTLEVDEVG